jgi:hypothetical protein
LSKPFPDVVLKNLTSFVTLEESDDRRVLRFESKVLFCMNVLLFVQVTLLNTDADVFVMETINIRVISVNILDNSLIIIMILLCCKKILDTLMNKHVVDLQ